MKNRLTIIGDCHGKFIEYQILVKDLDYSVQVGDMGFDYRALASVDYNRHVFIAGNHDNYDVLNNPEKIHNKPQTDRHGNILPFCPRHYLGEYGIYCINGVEFFAMSGGFSIDQKYRQKHEMQTGIRSWWAWEELSYEKMEDAYNLYCSIKPNIVITHECPRQIANIIGNPDILRNFGFDPETFTTRTSECLQKCYESWQPKLWIYGHYHKKENFLHNPAIPDVRMLYDDEATTRFICLPELATIEIDNEGNIY